MSDSEVIKTPEQQLFETLGGIMPPLVSSVMDVVQEKTAEVQEASRPISPKNIFWNSEAHPYVLDLVLLKFFGLEWFSWLPETVFTEIERTFNKSVGDITKMKIMAVQTLHVIDSFWERWEVFEKTILALNGVWPKLGAIQPLELPQLMSGVAIANDIRKEKFSDEVAHYVAACFLNANVTAAPTPLDFAQPYIAQPQYKCHDCDQIGSALPPFDGHCDSCSGKFDKANPLSFTPDPERTARGFGKNVSLFLEHDPLPTLKTFEKFIAMPPDNIVLRDVPEDVEAARLVVAHDYMLFRESQKDEQLAALKTWLGPTP